MKYQEALCSDEFPEMTAEHKDVFLRILACLDDHIVYVGEEGVVEKENSWNVWSNTAYLVNWKWNPKIFMDISKGITNPDPNFVKFVGDYALRMGIFEYVDDMYSRMDFENAMKGECRMTKQANSHKYAFQAETAFQAWLKAHNRGKVINES